MTEINTVIEKFFLNNIYTKVLNPIIRIYFSICVLEEVFLLSFIERKSEPEIKKIPISVLKYDRRSFFV